MMCKFSFKKILAAVFIIVLLFSFAGCDLSISNGMANKSSKISSDSSGRPDSSGAQSDSIEDDIICILPREEFFGVSITADYPVYLEGTEQITVVWSNKTDKSIGFGADFYLQIKTNGVWVDCCYELISHVELCYILYAYSELDLTYYINAYGNLGKGEYRIVTNFNAEGNNYNAFAEFAITDDESDLQILETVDNLFDEYGIHVSAYIWNNLMPMEVIGDDIPYVRPTYCVINIQSEKELPQIKVFATITSGCFATETRCKLSHGRYRAIEHFVIYGNYTIEITVQINDKQQSIILQGKVDNAF